MQTITVRAPAKVNLTFDILGKRPDGFHDIETIFQSISLEDELKIQIEESEQNYFAIDCDNPVLRRLMPLDESNLIGKAARAYLNQEKAGSHFNIRVHLDKKIPIGAGLAGGSSNAAAMLIALNSYFGNRLNSTELSQLASQIGSDVPFCLQGGTSIGRGKGEILEPIPCAIEFFYCIIKPRKLSVSTPWAYNNFDDYRAVVKKPDLVVVKNALCLGDIEAAIAGFGNVFEPMVMQEYPELAKLKAQVLDLGAWACQMTGSGPTLFAVVPGREMGHHIRRQILGDDDIGFVYGTEEIILEALPPIDFRLAESCSHGVRIV
ncbi:MAG: 4-(cytidine 5'-diphospho)-2-C-methyl-D-erythritol kinase [Candidatus Obscuribacterales bacterium]|nr:4-(cytidine 5'-diphospho)-2-C-methyl-D-erythritol kinase [Candidatus Obscuribacterales bacterium]